ncbi:MAG: PHP domain-containing protein [Ruminococcaceae bacterium]|nr:PHP domain-containing protein [Oscillospiraceae bacterium]
MNKYYYDLHIHSCLSPCGDDDMTPGNIAGMAMLNGLNIVALTDHNSAKNCPAFFTQAKKYGIVPVPGMELTTAEDVHVVCLFRSLEDALAFDKQVEEKRIIVKNKPAIFGHQYIMDEDDSPIGEEEGLLINATALSIEEAYELVKSFRGVCYPAHIDRRSNGMVAVLGVFPDDPPFTAFELNDGGNTEEYLARFPKLKDLTRAVSSDAHYLENISGGEHYFMIDDEPYSSDLVRNRLIDMLSGEERK